MLCELAAAKMLGNNTQIQDEIANCDANSLLRLQNTFKIKHVGATRTLDSHCLALRRRQTANCRM